MVPARALLPESLASKFKMHSKKFQPTKIEGLLCLVNKEMLVFIWFTRKSWGLTL